jgi:hypothetical protein
MKTRRQLLIDANSSCKVVPVYSPSLSPTCPQRGRGFCTELTNQHKEVNVENIPKNPDSPSLDPEGTDTLAQMRIAREFAQLDVDAKGFIVEKDVAKLWGDRGVNMNHPLVDRALFCLLIEAHSG